MSNSQSFVAEPQTVRADLCLSDLSGSAGACALSDPGPDPTYDPDEPVPGDVRER